MHEARHLVARAAQAALGALERERGLARDELGEAGGLADRAAHRVPPALAQLARGRGLARHDPAAVELAPRDPALAQRVRIARIAAQQIDEARAALAVALARKPRDAQRREQRIAVAGRAAPRASRSARGGRGGATGECRARPIPVRSCLPGGCARSTPAAAGARTGSRRRAGIARVRARLRPPAIEARR